MGRPLLIDTDPGVDDAMALLLALASPEVTLRAVTTVFGNHYVDQTTHNARAVLAWAGRAHIPVTAGAPGPLARPYRGPRRQIHGTDGLGGIGEEIGASTPSTAEAGGAAAAVVRAAQAQPGVLTLVTLGPLTNLALAVQSEPALPGLVREVVVMGGAVYCPGNASPVAEANFFNDPEAARQVLAAGWPITLVGLDVTMRTVMDAAYLRALAASGRPAGELIGRIVPAYLESYRQRHGLDGIPTHDPSAVAFAIDPSLFRTERVRVHVETEGRCAGQCVPDPRGQWPDLPEVQVCVDVDSDRLLALCREHLGR